MRPATRLLASQSTRATLLRTIVSTPELQKPEASAAQPQPDPAPDLPPRITFGGATIHIPNPDDAIEVFVDGYQVKIPKGMTVLQSCEIDGVDILCSKKINSRKPRVIVDEGNIRMFASLTSGVLEIRKISVD